MKEVRREGEREKDAKGFCPSSESSGVQRKTTGEKPGRNLGNEVGNKEGNDSHIALESRTYNFLVPGTMPVLEFEITSGKIDHAHGGPPSSSGGSNLHLEIYNPTAGEVFEAKFPKGRIEVDNDGSVAYFSRNAERVTLSIFLGRSVSLTIDKEGLVIIKSPSKISSLSIQQQGQQTQERLPVAEVESKGRGKRGKSRNHHPSKRESTGAELEVSSDIISFTLA
jgi:hypothetical protein